MAEGLARAYAAERGWAVEVASAGTLGIEGRPADSKALKVLAADGIDLSAHRSQGLSEALVGWADYILCMEMQHSAVVRQRFPEAEEKVMLLGSFGGAFEIEDPIGGWIWRFRRVYRLLDTCVTRFMDQLPPRVQGDDA